MQTSNNSAQRRNNIAQNVPIEPLIAANHARTAWAAEDTSLGRCYLSGLPRST
jgi:hypothetical protein